MRAIDELDAEAEKEYRETKLLKTLDMMESKMVHDMVLGNMPEEVLYYLDLKTSELSAAETVSVSAFRAPWINAPGRSCFRLSGRSLIIWT